MIRTAVISEVALSHWQRLADNIGKGATDIYNEPVFRRASRAGSGVHEARAARSRTFSTGAVLQHPRLR